MEEKERLIQSGRRHYSEMIGHEALPSPAYLRVFHDGLARQKARLARHLVTLAGLVAAARPGPVTLVSLARGSHESRSASRADDTDNCRDAARDGGRDPDPRRLPARRR